jgi:hypothetical protein
VDSPLDPYSDHATYRVACPTCNLAVWAGHGPPPEEGENLLDGHDCAGPVEAEAEPGTNGNDGVTVGSPTVVEVDPVPVAQDGTPSAEPVPLVPDNAPPVIVETPVEVGTTTEGPEQ